MRLGLIVFIMAIGAFTQALSFEYLYKMTASDAAEDNYFGYSSAMDRDILVVGAYGYNSIAGKVYVYKRNSTDIYEEIAQLSASDANESDFFGVALDISGDTIVVGAMGNDDNGSKSGSAYIFEKPSGGWTNATQTVKIIASDATDNAYFGGSVAIDNDVIVVGAYKEDNDLYKDFGSAYIFEKVDDNWVESAKLTASDPDSYDNFGISVDIENDTIVIGSYQNDNTVETTGSVYVFIKPSTGWTTATQNAKLFASDGDSGDRLGYSVALNGDIIVAGAYSDNSDIYEDAGSAYIFKKPDSGWVDATQSAKLTASDANESDIFGVKVDIDNDTIVVSAHKNDDNGENSGSAYVFKKTSGEWVDANETHKILAPDAASQDYFSNNVNIKNNILVIGAYGDDDNGSHSGSLYIYKDNKIEINPSTIMYLLD